MDPKDKAFFGLLSLVPEGEILKRIESLSERLSRRGVDAAVIMQNVDMFYFSGTIQRGFLAVSRQGEAVLYVQRDFERASAESPLEVRRARGLGELKSVEFLRRARTIGLELDVLPVATFFRLKDLLEGADLVDISSDILSLRAVKSPYEIRQMEEASRITARVLSSVTSFCRAGMTETELDALLQAEGRKLGHHGWLRMRGFNQEMTPVAVLSGPNGSFPSYVDGPLKGLGTCPAIGYGSSSKRIREGEPIVVDYGAGYNGYLTDETRTYVIGRLPRVLEDAYKVSLEILESFEAHAHPGKNGRELFEMALGIVGRYGLEEHFMGYGENRVRFVAHGIGLEINEWPVIAMGREEELKEGMVFALEPKFVFPGKGAVGVEVDYVVEKRWLRRLNSLSTDLFRL
ncbi:MAG: aminopeptidase P family protein [Deltaproteobacteria bacterium]|nr:MAG: aminopeptidase P family protein [Deltaproteobacteria bacterium]